MVATDLFTHQTSPLPVLWAKHEKFTEEIGFSVAGSRQSKFRADVQSEVVPGTVKVPERVPLRVIEEVCAAVLPEEVVPQRDGRK